ncbi:hypothetical protein L1987_09290 [Smallanthus sonchifolius]|uniref:Uncharacterized protein n=1 Tax=Smallanthus sonchifolius TaxID=185202 RepID=A0ACB9JPG8_9ASTR|nr:hypothetical protein L1987_09290 [Smallanthus sonchifolius]
MKIVDQLAKYSALNFEMPTSTGFHDASTQRELNVSVHYYGIPNPDQQADDSPMKEAQAQGKRVDSPVNESTTPSSPKFRADLESVIVLYTGLTASASPTQLIKVKVKDFDVESSQQFEGISDNAEEVDIDTVESATTHLTEPQASTKGAPLTASVHRDISQISHEERRTGFRKPTGTRADTIQSYEWRAEYRELQQPPIGWKYDA